MADSDKNGEASKSAIELLLEKVQAEKNNKRMASSISNDDDDDNNNSNNNDTSSSNPVKTASMTSKKRSKKDDLLTKTIPINTVKSIIDRIKTKHTDISEDAVAHIQNLTAEYLSILISGARDQCLYSNRKTLDSDDVLTSMAQLGFLDQKDSLSRYIDKYKTAMALAAPLPPLPKEKAKKEPKAKEPKIKETATKKKYYIPKKQRKAMEEEEKLAAQLATTTTTTTTEEQTV